MSGRGPKADGYCEWWACLPSCRDRSVTGLPPLLEGRGPWASCHRKLAATAGPLRVCGSTEKRHLPRGAGSGSARAGALRAGRRPLCSQMGPNGQAAKDASSLGKDVRRGGCSREARSEGRRGLPSPRGPHVTCGPGPGPPVGAAALRHGHADLRPVRRPPPRPQRSPPTGTGATATTSGAAGR